MNSITDVRHESCASSAIIQARFLQLLLTDIYATYYHWRP